MYAQVDKSKENKSRVIANSVTQNKGNEQKGFGFVDNRPEAIAQIKVQETASSSVKQLGKKGNNKVAPTPKVVSEEDEFKDALKKHYSISAGDTNSKNVGGGGGGGGPFITPTNGTRHHIYPKSSLIDPAFAVSKALKAFTNVNASESVSSKAKVYGQTQFNSLKALGTNVGLNDNGTVAGMANYYWNRGLHFFGINTGERADDPGSNPEPHKPNSLDATKFQRPLDFGAAMQKVKSNLNNIGSSGSIDMGEIKDARTKYSAMDGSGSLYTNPLKGSDWTLKPRPNNPQKYNEQWGGAYKIYILNRTGDNDYKAYPQNQLELIKAQSSTTLKTIYNLANANHEVLTLAVFGVPLIGAGSHADVAQAIVDFNTAAAAVQPHLVYDNMRSCLVNTKSAHEKAQQHGTLSVGINTTFTNAITAVENAENAINANQHEDITLSR